MADKKKKSAEEQQDLDRQAVEQEVAPQGKTSLTDTQQAAKDKYAYIIKRKSVRQKARRKTISLVMIIFVLVAILITGLVYGVLTFIDFNSFRISVERSNLSYIALSEDYEFTDPTSVLSVSGPKVMDNIGFYQLPIQKMLNETGSLSEDDDNFIACSFYLCNRGDHAVYYSENILLTKVYKGLEDTIRILLIKQLEKTDAEGNKYWSDPEYRCYAKVSADGVTPEYVSGGDEVIPDYAVDPNDNVSNWVTIPFYAANSGVVLDATYYPLLKDQKVRYAMAVWIEGTDPECSDDKLGGKVSYSFEFKLETDDNNVVINADEE